MTALADTPVRLSKKARRRLAAVPRIPDHRELNPTSHPLPPGRGQGEGSSSPPTTPTPGGTGVPPVSSPPRLPSPSPESLCELRASAAKTLPASSSSSSSESPSPLCALCASAVNPVFASILPDYLSATFSLPALAERHNLSLLELIDLLDSPQFIERIDRLNAIAERRAATVALHARPGALAGLEAVIATTTSPETARKAGATLIRASDRVLTPKRAQPRISATQTEPPPAADASPSSAPDPASTEPRAQALGPCPEVKPDPQARAPDSASAP